MDDFANFRQIGKGKDSIVYSATCPKLGGGSVVLKVYDKAKISAIKHRSVRREARIMRFLTDARIPYCCHYIGAFQDSKQIYIVMEHCAGGDLLEQLLKEGRAMTEKRVVREVVVPILTSLANLHAAGIIHRDIKLENLFASPDRGIMLGDFGLALCVHEEKPISPVGTLEYMPPEILQLPSTDLIVNGTVKPEDVTPVDEKVDQWSFGVTVYELVTGRSPFEGASKDEIRANILRHNMRPLPSFLTAECADWIGNALTADPASRPSALQLLRHKWVAKNLHAEDAARIAEMKVAPPKMVSAPSATATRAPSGANEAAAAGETGAPKAAAAAAAVTREPARAAAAAAVEVAAAAAGHPAEAALAAAAPAAVAAHAAEAPVATTAIPAASTAAAGVPARVVAAPMTSKFAVKEAPTGIQSDAVAGGIPAYVPPQLGEGSTGGTGPSMFRSGSGAAAVAVAVAANIGASGESTSSTGSSNSTVSAVSALSVADSASSMAPGAKAPGEKSGATGSTAKQQQQQQQPQPQPQQPVDGAEQQQQQLSEKLLPCKQNLQREKSKDKKKLFKWMCSMMDVQQ